MGRLNAPFVGEDALELGLDEGREGALERAGVPGNDC